MGLGAATYEERMDDETNGVCVCILLVEAGAGAGAGTAYGSDATGENRGMSCSQCASMANVHILFLHPRHQECMPTADGSK